MLLRWEPEFVRWIFFKNFSHEMSWTQKKVFSFLCQLFRNAGRAVSVCSRQCDDQSSSHSYKRYQRSEEMERTIYSKPPNGLSIRLFIFEMENLQRTIDGGQCSKRVVCVHNIFVFIFSGSFLTCLAAYCVNKQAGNRQNLMFIGQT